MLWIMGIVTVLSIGMAIQKKGLLRFSWSLVVLLGVVMTVFCALSGIDTLEKLRFFSDPGYHAELLLAQGDYAEAEKEFDRALGWTPDVAVLHDGRGRALQAQDRAEEALEAFQQAVTLEPNGASYRYHRAMALAALGRYEESLPDLDAIILQDLSNGAYYRARGEALFQCERYEEAAPDLMRAIEFGAPDPGAPSLRELYEQAASQMEN